MEWYKHVIYFLKGLSAQYFYQPGSLKNIVQDGRTCGNASVHDASFASNAARSGIKITDFKKKKKLHLDQIGGCT
jgi:hypothetical protein